MKKKTEIITERSITISVKGENKQAINAALAAAFNVVLKRLRAGRYYGSSLVMGKNKMIFGVEEQAKYV